MHSRVSASGCKGIEPGRDKVYPKFRDLQFDTQANHKSRMDRLNKYADAEVASSADR